MNIAFKKIIPILIISFDTTKYRITEVVIENNTFTRTIYMVVNDLVDICETKVINEKAKALTVNTHSDNISITFTLSNLIVNMI